MASPLTIHDLTEMSVSGDVRPQNSDIDGDVTLPESSQSAELRPQRMPPELWGLSSLFRCYWKMYVADLLTLPGNPLHSGSFYYGSHPVGKVELQGVVVAARSNHKFSTYSLDDGTGVINCVCWKKPELQPTAVRRLSDLAAEVGSELSVKVCELQDESRIAHGPSHLGDLLRVRGRLRDFRGQREVMCQWHARLADPNEESLWMLDLPDLYKSYYDQGILLPQRVVQSACVRGEGSAEGVTELLVQCQIQKAVVSYLTESGDAVITASKLRNIKEIANITQAESLKESRVKHMLEMTITQLVSQGLAFPKPSSLTEYVVTENCPELTEAVLQVLRTEGQRQQYGEQGCHYKHILDQVKETMQYARLTTAALIHSLSLLETSSEIVSTSEKHYMCIPT